MHRLPFLAPRVLLVAGILVAGAQLLASAAQSSGALLSSFTDDYYYYHVVARNFVTGGGLSFDRIEPTNGFHPLWFAIVSALRGLLGEDRATLLAVKTLCALLPLAGAYGMGRFARMRLVPGERTSAVAIAAIYYALAFYLSKQGMEIALTLALLPFLLLALERGVRDTGDLFRLTLLAALTILSRLDSAILVLPLWMWGAGGFLLPQLRAGAGPLLRAAFAPGVVLAVMAGFAPLLLYVGANLALFGGLLPQSAGAKALVTAPGPYGELLNALAWPWTWLLLALWGGGAAAWALSRDSWRLERLPGWWILVWPALFYASLAFRSPWPLWQWYLYPLASSAVASLCVRPSIAPRLYALALPLLALAVAGVVAAKHVGESRNAKPNSLVEAAEALAGFERTHPGRYAMGDRAGAVGYRLGSPVLQLEGLVGGGDVIGAVGGERPLAEFLRAKRVRYYVATDLIRGPDGCYAAAEPKQGGAVRRMRSSFCTAPVFTYRAVNPDGQVIETQVFDLAPVSPQENRP